MIFRKNVGFTIVEMAIVIAISGILASAVATTIIPMMNFFFYYPQSSRVNNAAADLIDIVFEGDSKARGLRFTGPPCTLGGAGGGGSTITAATTSGTTSTLTYNYMDPDYCGSNAARVSHTVTIVFDSSTGKVTRAIDGGTANYTPDYVNSASDIVFAAPSGGTDLFHYFGIDGTTDLGSTPLAAITFVKNVATNPQWLAAANTITATLGVGISVAQYNFLVVSVATDGGADNTQNFVVTDTKNNAYLPNLKDSDTLLNKIDGTNTNAKVRVMIFYAPVTTALVAGDVITLTWTTNVTARAISVAEFSNVNTFDAAQENNGNGTANFTSNNATTTVADELIFGAVGVEGPSGDNFDPTVTVPAWNLATRVSTGHATATSNVTINPMYKIVNTTGTYAASASSLTSRDWSATVGAFYNSPIYRVDIDVIASQGNGQVNSNVGQIRLKSGVEIKRYTT